MAALASSLIRQKRAVKDDQANRPIANKRRPCPKSNKSLCQKQILVLISKVRLCGGRRGRTDKRPGTPVSLFNRLTVKPKTLMLPADKPLGSLVVCLLGVWLVNPSTVSLKFVVEMLLSTFKIWGVRTQNYTIFQCRATELRTTPFFDVRTQNYPIFQCQNYTIFQCRVTKSRKKHGMWTPPCSFFY